MRPHLPTLLLAVALAAPALAAPALAAPALAAPAPREVAAAHLDRLPRFDPARPQATLPGWSPERVEVRLHPAAARRLVPAGAVTARAATPARALGLPGLDAVARATGVAFEPEFAGEAAPAAPDEPDLTAYWIAHLPPGLDLGEALARLAACPEVERAEPIAVLPVAFAPNDSLWPVSTWFSQPSGRDIAAAAAWDVARADSGAVIAILDTGVIPYHPDLGGVTAGLTGALFVNRAERGGVAGVDDDLNGFVDDVSGWDFVALASDVNVAAGEDWRDADADPNDFAGHGTAVAGIAAALTDNTIGVAGTAFGARILPVRMGWATLGNPLGLVDMSFAAQAVRYATRMGATVINCSFATLDLSGLGDAVRAAVRAGVTVVFAAGNAQPQEVGQRPDVIAVAALQADDVVAAFSNQGDWIDLAAPGVDVAKPFVTRIGADSIAARQPAYEAEFDGTSFAAPMVSGAVALLQSQRRARGLPPLSPYDVLLRLRDTADDIADRNPPGTRAGTGRLDLYRALTDPPVSMATRAGAQSVGPAVVLGSASGRVTVVQPMANSRLLFLDGATLDTLRVVTLPMRPLRQLAAADLGGGRGVGLFVGGQSGRIAGFDRDGAPLPGWPQTAGGGINQLAGGPALGDIDGDGLTDVVCGGTDGDLWAWEAGGDVKAGFPVTLDGNPIGAAVALAELDARPGLEIVAVTDAGLAPGAVHAIDGTGTPLPGWPAQSVDAGAQSPVVTAFGTGGEPAVVAAWGSTLVALRPDGAPRFTVTLPGAVFANDPAVADLDGDGAMDLVIGTSAPALAAYDSSGAALAARGWPRALGAFPGGTPVVGPVRPGGRAGVLVYVGQELLAFDDSARAVGRFPMPGGAGLRPTLADLDGDSAAEVAAGTGPDSTLFVYDAGAGTWAAPPGPWPTPRGNHARTGSFPAPGLPARDDVGPDAVADLRADSVGANGARLRWSTPADPGTSGVASFDLRLSGTPITSDAAFAAAAPLAGLPAPGAAGTPQVLRVTGLAAGDTVHFAIRATDGAGNAGARSADLAVVTPPAPPVDTIGPPLTGRVGVAVVSRAQPSRVPVEFLWQGAAEAVGTPQALRVHDVSGRLVRTLALGTAARGRLTWDGRDERGRLVPAGLYFARLSSGSFHAQTRVVLLP